MTTHSTQPKISLATATIISMNAMIGAGIFTTPAKFALSVGPAGIITYIFIIIAVLFMALSLARVVQTYPQEGSFYTYAKQWGGHAMGVAAAGAYALGVVIALGLLTKMAAFYLHEYIPSISVSTFGFLLVALVVTLNVIGVKIMQLGQIILLCCTLFALLATTLFGFTHAHTSYLTPFAPYGWGSLITALPIVIFAFFGFESSASLYAQVKNPEQNVPKALVYSILIVGSIYVAFITAITLSLPSHAFASPQTPLSQALVQTYPHFTWLGHAIGIAILTAFLGVLQSMTYSVSVLIFTFFKFLRSGYAQKITRHPENLKIIIIAVGLCTLFNFFMLNSIGLFFNLTALFIVFAYASSIVTLLIKDAQNPKDKIIAALGLATSALIFGSALMGIIT